MIKKIFALSIVALALFAFANNSKAQSMSFCEDVSSSGNPIGESSTFNISSSGGYLDVLVNIPYDLNCTSIRYEIYYNGAYDNTIYQDSKRNWQWFYQKVTFYKSGTYVIYCIDCNEQTLASGTLRIQFN
jgi:hypothetical protein